MPVIIIAYFLLKSMAYVDPSFDPDTVKLATIHRTLSGCFTSNSDRLTLYRKNDFYFALLATSNKQKQTIKLSAEQVASIYNFIQECKTLPTAIGLCTNEETYRIQVNSQQFVVTNGSCTWRGFDRLQRILLSSDNPK